MRLLTFTFLLLAGTLPALSDDFILQDNRKLSDSLLTIKDRVCKLVKGRQLDLALIKQIDLAQIGKPKSSLRVHLIGGDVLAGKLGQKIDRGVTLTSQMLGQIRIKLEGVALIDFGGKGKIPDDPARDVDYLYYINKEGEVVHMKGALESISPKNVSFMWKLTGKTYSLPLAKVRGLRMGRTNAPAESDGMTVSLTLRDGSTLTGEALEISEKRIALHHVSDRVLRLPRSSIARIVISSDWVIYLAREKPISIRTDRLYGAGKLLPAYRKNTSIWGGSLAPYSNGIGTYGTTVLSYNLRGRYKTFKSAIWIATLSKTAGLSSLSPQGEVIFRVYGDGKKLYDSGLVRATDKPKDIEVDVRDVRRLSIEVNRGPGWGVGDAGNWGNPHVHK